MIRILILTGVAVFFGVTIGLVPVASAGPFRTVQQTKEPPLFGQPKMQPLIPVPVVPPPFGPPQTYPQVPYGPAPYTTQPFPPAPLTPAPFTPAPFTPAPFMPPLPGAVEVPCPPIDPPPPTVKIQVRVVDCSGAGQEIEYCIRVENCSPAPAHHVVVRNPVPGNCKFVRAKPEPASVDKELVWTFGTLQCGECKEITLVLMPTDTADVKNCARVQFEHGQCVVTRIAKAPPGAVEPPKGIEPPKVIESPNKGGAAKLSLKISGPKSQYANLPAQYQIIVTNSGDKEAEKLLLTAFLPDKAEFTSASDNGRFHFSQVAWVLGNLPAGASKTVQVTYKVPVAGEFCAKASALADPDIRTEAETCTKFEGVSALHLQTADAKDPVGVGEQVSYRITIKNQGSANLSNVQIQVLVPTQFLLLDADGPTARPKQENLPAPTPEGQALTFAPLKELKPAEVLVYEVTARAMKPGDARWKTVLTADQLQGGPVTWQESTNVFREEEINRPMPPPGLQTGRPRLSAGR